MVQLKEILTSGDKYLQEVLGTSIIEKNNDGTTESFTFLTYAIEFGEIDVAQAILDTASQVVLDKLLSVESIIRRIGGTKKFTALSLAEGYAKEEAYADLANKIREKLGIPVLDKKDSLEEEALNKDEGLVPSDSGNENFTSRTSNNLFWAVLRRNGKAATATLKISRNQSDDITTILKAGLTGLCIGDERAKALATKGDEEIIKDIKTGQAFVISLIGLVVVVLAVAAIVLIISIAPELTAGPIIGIVIAGVIGAAGFAGVGFAVFHDSHKIPDTQLEKVGQNAVDEGLAH